MKTNKTIILDEQDFGPLYEEITLMVGEELGGVDSRTHEGHEFAKNNPTLAKLIRVLESELVKDQSLLAYNKLPGDKIVAGEVTDG